jgi:NAD(P)-dependent dehydrogenase (short-subunit alcohol dehydrogenase family)
MHENDTNRFVSGENNYPMDFFKLDGKLAVVTGGGGLLGYSHAKSLLLKKCIVELWDINPEGLAKNYAKLSSEFPESNIRISQVDITKENEVINQTNEIIEGHGKVDILINNAGINPKFNSEVSGTDNSFGNFSVDSWQLEVSVGLTGAILCSKYIGLQMAANHSGVILNIASDLSVIAPNQRIYEKENLDREHQFKKPLSYSVIKTGLIGLTRYLATYWAEDGIRVNALSPGGVYENQDSEFVKKISGLIPLGRMAKNDEYIGAVQFLCSDASAYMTGQNIVIDGGRSIW